ncbi:MAG: phosphate ABC transporter ATP-binding protein [Anaerolineae bacterium]|nr:phosphate ABC transporter ATP-binding protein [Anaerolineae bacterium]
MNTLSILDLNVWYGNLQALKAITADIPPNKITAIIGPSGCGKSTLLKSLNRLLELVPDTRIAGQIKLNDFDIYSSAASVTEVRTHIGLLPQKPFPLPMSIYDNVAYPIRIHALLPRKGIPDKVEETLLAVGLWDEVKDRLRAPAFGLSVGQQQRLCLARALAVEPQVLLCDESTSALDPMSARTIEDLLIALKEEYTIVTVTHNLGQAERLADHVLFLWLGELLEQGPAVRVFQSPEHPLMAAYLAREFG